MSIKALLLDFYGTVVEEDDQYIRICCEKISKNSPNTCNPKEIGHYWGQRFASLCNHSFGENFQTQRKLETISLQKTVEYFGSVDGSLVKMRVPINQEERYLNWH